VVQNGQITLKDVPSAGKRTACRLATPFRDTARVLRMTRYMVGWASTGVQMGAFENTLKYAQERLQFGKPIASFRWCRILLAKMLANVTACQCLMVRLAQMDDEGKLADHHASLAKAFCTAKSRETVAWGRELLGGNGIVADYNVARFFADAEALYSYEGTYQMQNLILGKAITGLGAFRVSQGRASGCSQSPASAGSPAYFQTGDANMAPATATLTPSPAVVPTASPTAALTLANVLYEKKGAIAYVTVNRPKVLNAPEYADVERFADRVRDARDDTAIRGVILTGAGNKAFHRRCRHRRARACRGVLKPSSPAVSGRRYST